MVTQQAEAEDAPIECGVAAARCFPFEKGSLNLNHGSFGAAPLAVRSVQRHYQDACDAHPDIFIRYHFPRLLYNNRAALAKYLKAPTSSVVLVQNATTALNTVLRDLVFNEGDVAIYFSTIYGSIEKTLIYLSETTPLKLFRIPLVYPLSHAKLIDAFRSAIADVRDQGRVPRISIIDTISSLPGVRVPFEELVKLCRHDGIISCVDGAHGAGQIPLDLTALDPDYFTTNLHKWLHVPRPCAALYVPERNQKLIRSTLPTSHGFVPAAAGSRINNPLPPTGIVQSAFEINFEFVGTLDTSSYLCIEAALKWRGMLKYGNLRGECAIQRYCSDQAYSAGLTVAHTLGTKMLINAEISRGNFMMNVWLPLEYKQLFGEGPLDMGKIVEVARWIEECLVTRYRTFVAVIFHGQAWMVRLSAQVYLTKDDWRKAGEWLREACELAKKEFSNSM